MAAKLKNLKVTKVDFVDQGANQRADVNLFKRKETVEPEAEPEGETRMSLFKRFARWFKGEDASEEEIEKAATSFNEELLSTSTEKIQEEIWNVVYALRNALSSILVDPELDSASRIAGMEESLQQFDLAMKSYFSSWCAGNAAGVQKSLDSYTETELALMKSDHAELENLINKAESSDGTVKGDIEEMIKVDKSKMTPEMQAVYDEMVAKNIIVDDDEEVAKAAGEQVEEKNDPAEEQLEKSAPVVNPEIEELKKSMKAEIEALKKQREAAEDAALMEVAKRYEILGRKPEELVKKFKALKAVSEDLYNDEISALDELAKSMESGLFTEIGKGVHSDNNTSAIKKARTLAEELRKSNPALSSAEALDQVLLSNDDLRKALDQ